VRAGIGIRPSPRAILRRRGLVVKEPIRVIEEHHDALRGDPREDALNLVHGQGGTVEGVRIRVARDRYFDNPSLSVPAASTSGAPWPA
jgi:hypothetical protein